VPISRAESQTVIRAQRRGTRLHQTSSSEDSYSIRWITRWYICSKSLMHHIASPLLTPGFYFTDQDSRMRARDLVTSPTTNQHIQPVRNTMADIFQCKLQIEAALAQGMCCCIAIGRVAYTSVLTCDDFSFESRDRHGRRALLQEGT